jgi:hypothetical protein
MTYETILLIEVLTALIGGGFLLRHFGHMAWHLERSGEPSVIIMGRGYPGMVVMGCVFGNTGDWMDSGVADR